MKKLIGAVISIMLTIVALFGIVGCGGTDNSAYEKRIDELQSKIEEMEDKLAERNEQIRERDEKIELLEKQLIGELAEGSFYSLTQAYDNGWLTKEDLMSIAYYNNFGRWGNEEIMGETYAPAPKTPETLSAETELEIKITAAKDFNEENNTNYKAEDFTITHYYGTYGGCVALIVKDNYSGSFGVEYIETIAGVDIYHRHTNANLLIWREI